MYKHTVQYYETDRMGITHHSNYIRFMEEARVCFLNEIGFGYEHFEENGIISPVVSVKCEYKKTSTFGDIVSISLAPKEIKAARLIMEYKMTNQNGELVLSGESEHCFIKGGKILRIERDLPAFHLALKEKIGVFS